VFHKTFINTVIISPQLQCVVMILCTVAKLTRHACNGCHFTVSVVEY